MLGRTDIVALSIGAASAFLAGAGLGAWTKPPAYLHQPITQQEPQASLSEDPNLTLYRQVIDAQGGPTPPPVPVVAAPSATSAKAAFERDPSELEAQSAREVPAFQARARGWEAERTAWLDARQAGWREELPIPSGIVAPDSERLAEAEPLTADERAPGDGRRVWGSRLAEP